MPRFRITIEKNRPDTQRTWTNIYYVNVADLQTAITHIANFANAERALYPSFVYITKGRADDAVANTDQYGTQVFNAAGLRTPPNSDSAPLWVTARVDFTVAGFTSPSRKYLRGCLFESDFTINALGTDITALLNTYADTVVALPFCDVDMEDIIDGVPFPAPQMRQLKRGSKKKNTP